MQNRALHADVEAKLKEFKSEDPGLGQLLKDAYGYALFPEVGKASLVVGGSYGQGEVYEKKKLIGYATMSQFTVGVQVGGDTFSELILFESKDALDRFKSGKVEFAANASAVLVRAGTAKVNDYEQGVKTLAISSGGMLLEAAIGGQKFTFKPASETEQSGGEKKPPASRRQRSPGKRASATRKKSVAGSGRHARPVSRSKRRSAARTKRR
jgi:lipid-binding SYLF domain-containing protein